jgi:hypothetical protein
VKIITDRHGAMLEYPVLVNTFDTDGGGQHARAVVEALDGEPLGIDPLHYL